MLRKALFGIAGLGLLAGAFGGYRYHAASQFAASFEAYDVLAGAHSRAAFAPAVESNPLRQELNRTLARALSDTTLDDSERLELAHKGLALLDEAEKQIDAIEAAGEPTDGAISAMEEDASGVEREAIVSLARERFRIIADIRSLSYRANFHVAEIFNRIIRDEGGLTDAHVLELNEQVPAMEEQFDERTNLYSDLEDIGTRMDSAYAELGVF